MRPAWEAPKATARVSKKCVQIFASPPPDLPDFLKFITADVKKCDWLQKPRLSSFGEEKNWMRLALFFPLVSSHRAKRTCNLTRRTVHHCRCCILSRIRGGPVRGRGWLSRTAWSLLRMKDKLTESGQTFEGSFSDVSKPNFASKYASESSRRDLQNALLCTVL